MDFEKKRRGRDSREQIEPLLQAYVRKVRALQVVRLVAADVAGREPEVWTIIDASPGALAARDCVHAAELAAAEEQPAATAAFRVVNARDFPGTPLDRLLPADARVCYSV